MFWSQERIHKLSVSLLIAIALALVIGTLLDTHHTGLILRGDFPGFYGLAVIAHSGQFDQLYDPVLQTQIHNQYWPSLEGGSMLAVYPPWAAVLLSPLGYFDARTARIIFDVICICSFGIALCAIQVCRQQKKLSSLQLIVFSVFFAPTFIGLFGGQNTSLSVLLFVGACLLSSSPRPVLRVGAGALLGFWLFKPQFAILFIPFLMLGKYYAQTLGMLMVAAFYGILATFTCGLNWPSQWLHAAASYGTPNMITNGIGMASIPSTLSAVALRSSLGDAGKWILIITGHSIAALILLRFAFLIFRVRNLPSLQRTNLSEHVIFLLGCVFFVTSPQSLYYDLAIPFFACARYVRLQKDLDYWILLSVLVVSWVITLTREQFGPWGFVVFSIAGLLFVYQQYKSEFQKLASE